MEWYMAIFLFAISTTVTPGPNNIMILSSGVNFGIQKSIPHLLGIAIGFPAMVLAVGLGFNVVFQAYPIIHEVIKVAGIIYLLYLAWIVANSAPTSLNIKKLKPISFIQAALFQWVNPKAWVMATGAISAFTTLSNEFSTQVIIIAFSFLLVAMPCVGIWLVFGSHLARVLKSQRQQKVFNISMALLLVVSIMPSAVELGAQYLS